MRLPSRGFRRTRERVSGVLFALGIDDLSFSAPNNLTPTLTRDSGRTVVDSTGRLTTIGNSALPWSTELLADGRRVPGLDLQNSSGNLCLRSEDFSQGWTAIGSPTRTGAAKRCGDLVLDLLGDDAGGALEGYFQNITFTGDGTKALSVFMAAGSASSCVIRLRDTSASATRGQITITWTNGVPSVTTQAGTYVGEVELAGGVYRFRLQCLFVVAANTTRVEIYPATTSALATSSTGTTYVGGVQAENFGTPTAYCKTLGSAASRTKDYSSAALALPTQDISAYGEVVFYAGMNAPVFQLMQSASFAGYVRRHSDGSLRVAIHDAIVDATMPSDEIVSFCARFRDYTSTPQCQIETDLGTSAWSSSSSMTFTSFDELRIGTSTASDDDGGAVNTLVRKLVIAPGLRSLAEMRGIGI